MQPRAFVIMPYGLKMPTAFNDRETPSGIGPVDFDQVYDCLLKPALIKAGCEAVRADSEGASGDVRTDMFFELVTADLVVADVSIQNANVFYELGVRHGVCPRGVFTVNGNLSQSRPFDISPDRSFNYDARVFSQFVPDVMSKEAFEKRRADQCDVLSKKLKEAIAVDPETIGSPVYSHLPGLIPVQWDQIQTSKAKYFNSLQDDWLDCVRSAQASGHPGDILTLARFAPTRLHERWLLGEAADALIDMCRYSAAEAVLREIIRLDPQDSDAQVQLALVLSRQGKYLSAEHQLRKVLQQHKDDPNAADLLGQVLRYLWALAWKGPKCHEEQTCERRAKAKNARQVAISAIHSFVQAHRTNSMAYFAGFNALMLAYVLVQIGMELDESCTLSDCEDLQVIVRYTASNIKEKAIQEGDYEQQFWCTTTLAGLALLDKSGDDEKALARVREACAIPRTSSFQLQCFRDRLELLEELDVRCGFVHKALSIVDLALRGKSNHCLCERVFVWSGYSIGSPQFPSGREEALQAQIEAALKSWNLNAHDLTMCTCTTESDIIFAETCHQLGARIRLLLKAPTSNEPAAPVLAFSSPEWRDRFHKLILPGERKEIWYDAKQLGTPPNRTDPDKFTTFLKHRQTEWLINTAQMEAEPITVLSTTLDPAPHIGPLGRLHGLFFWDGKVNPDDPYDTSRLVKMAGDFNGFQGEVKIISPQDLALVANPLASHKDFQEIASAVSPVPTAA